MQMGIDEERSSRAETLAKAVESRLGARSIETRRASAKSGVGEKPETFKHAPVDDPIAPVEDRKG